MRRRRGAMTEKEWRAALRQFQRALDNHTDQELRRIYREEYGLVYRRAYQVRATFVPYRKRSK